MLCGHSLPQPLPPIFDSLFYLHDPCPLCTNTVRHINALGPPGSMIPLGSMIPQVPRIPLPNLHGLVSPFSEVLFKCHLLTDTISQFELEPSSQSPALCREFCLIHICIPSA